MEIEIIIFIVFVAVIAGALPAIIAYKKGRSFFRWWVYGALLFPAALPHALFIGTSVDIGTRKCLYCHTQVRLDKPHCPKCGYEFIEF